MKNWFRDLVYSSPMLIWLIILLFFPEIANTYTARILLTVLVLVITFSGHKLKPKKKN